MIVTGYRIEKAQWVHLPGHAVNWPSQREVMASKRSKDQAAPWWKRIWP